MLGLSKRFLETEFRLDKKNQEKEKGQSLKTGQSRIECKQLLIVT